MSLWSIWLLLVGLAVVHSMEAGVVLAAIGRPWVQNHLVVAPQQKALLLLLSLLLIPLLLVVEVPLGRLVPHTGVEMETPRHFRLCLRRVVAAAIPTVIGLVGLGGLVVEPVLVFQQTLVLEPQTKDSLEVTPAHRMAVTRVEVEVLGRLV